MISKAFLAVLGGSFVFLVLLIIQLGLRVTGIVYASAFVAVMAAFTGVELSSAFEEWRRK